MKFDCTGVILAGGKNVRLPGKKKAFQKVGETTIIDKLYRLFSALFKETIIVVNEPRDFTGLNMTIVTDIFPSRCALAGLHAGLFYASFPHVYATACDTPFADKKVIEYIVNQVDEYHDIVLPRTDDGFEALCATYSRKCLPVIEKNLKNNILMIKKFYDWERVKEIPPATLKALDPDMQFIFNINTPDDLKKARKMASSQVNRNKSKN